MVCARVGSEPRIGAVHATLERSGLKRGMDVLPLFKTDMVKLCRIHKLMWDIFIESKLNVLLVVDAPNGGKTTKRRR